MASVVRPARQKTMAFGETYLVSSLELLSSFMSLHTERLITSTTPPGVRHGQMPPVSLRGGNEVRLDVDRLDEQRQRLAE